MDTASYGRNWPNVVVKVHRCTVVVRIPDVLPRPVPDQKETQARPPSRQPSRLHPRTLQRITEYIDARLHEHIDLATLAGIANVSRFHFARLFRASTGVSAMSYLEKRRMERAQALIRRGDLQLASIASLVGYDDPSYFTRRFRHFCGQTPSNWARTH